MISCEKYVVLVIFLELVINVEGYTSLFTNFFDFWLCVSRWEKYFLTVLSKLSQASLVKIFQTIECDFRDTPKGGVLSRL